MLLNLVGAETLQMNQRRRSRGGWVGFSPPTFEEDDIFFVFVLVYVYFTLYPG